MSFLDDWKEWSTAKKVISIIAVCCIGIFIIAMITGGLSQDKNTAKTASNTSGSNNSNTNVAKGVQIHIIYDGSWSGAMGSGSSTKSISGSGETTLDIDDSNHIVSANAQKMDGGSGKLTIQILKDGKVVEETDTDAEYGVVSVSATV